MFDLMHAFSPLTSPVSHTENTAALRGSLCSNNFMISDEKASLKGLKVLRRQETHNSSLFDVDL